MECCFASRGNAKETCLLHFSISLSFARLYKKPWAALKGSESYPSVNLSQILFMILQQAAKPLTLPPKEKPRRKQVEEFFHKAESNSIA